jgi:hypothetical protein
VSVLFAAGAPLLLLVVESGLELFPVVLSPYALFKIDVNGFVVFEEVGRP